METSVRVQPTCSGLTSGRPSGRRVVCTMARSPTVGCSEAPGTSGGYKGGGGEGEGGSGDGGGDGEMGTVQANSMRIAVELQPELVYRKPVSTEPFVPQ